MQLPKDTKVFFKKIAEITAFDPIDLSDPINQVFDLDDKVEPFSANFLAMGYETSYLFTNMGTLLPICIAGIVFLPLLLLVSWCFSLSLSCEKAKDYFQRLTNRTFCNGILIFWDGM